MISNSSFQGYAILHSPNYSFGGEDAMGLLRSFVTGKMECGVSILDVGAGSGAFLAQCGSLAHPNMRRVGVSAKPYKNPPNGVEFMYGNVENIVGWDEEIGGKSHRKYDFIVSSETFRHLQDPLGTCFLATSILQE